jgi:tetratricopeptide (TPR) repeat protein
MSRCKTDCGKWAFNDGFCRNCAKQAKTPTSKRVDKAPVVKGPATTSFQLEPHPEETAAPMTGRIERALAAFVVDGSDRIVAAPELELVTQRGLQLYEEELRASRETLGDRHPDTLTSIDSMATLLKGMGKPQEARLLLEEELRARRETLGDHHVDTLLSISNMGQLLQAMGQLEAARSLYEEALQASREVQGDHHPDTLTLLDSMGLLYEASG